MQEASTKRALALRERANKKDMLIGLLLVALSVFCLYTNLEYELGTASRMGPGYMPMLVFGLLGIFGLAIIGLAFFNGPVELESWAWRQLGFVLASLIVFAAVLRHAGLGVAVLLLVVISTFADKTQTFKGTIGLAVGLVVLCWVIFIYGLQMSIPFLPPALGYNY